MADTKNKSLYRQSERRDKGYSLSGGQFKIVDDKDEDYGPQPKPNASAAEKTGLVKEDPAKQKEWKIMSEDGKEESVPVGPKEDPKEKANPLDFASDPKAAQQHLKDQGVDIAVDGKWGKGSMKALNDYYNANPDVEPQYATQLDSIFKDNDINQKSYVGKTNYHIDGKPVDYKRGEVSSGGEVHPTLVKSVEDEFLPMKDAIPGLRITGGNDAYHHSDEYYSRRVKKHRSRKNSKKFQDMSQKEAAAWGRKNLKPSGHTDGRSMDFASKDPEAARQSFLDNGFKFVKGNPPRYVKGNVTILDEYAGKTSGGSGGHFHWGTKDGHH